MSSARKSYVPITPKHAAAMTTVRIVRRRSPGAWLSLRSEQVRAAVEFHSDTANVVRVETRLDRGQETEQVPLRPTRSYTTLSDVTPTPSRIKTSGAGLSG